MFRLITISALVVLAGCNFNYGETVVEKDPYIIALEENEAHVCAGTLIRDNVVLTSARCTDKKNPKNLRIRAGASDKGNGGEIAGVTDICQHPKFNKEANDYDFSVLHLSRSLVNNKDIKPIGLYPPDSGAVASGSCAAVVSWGLLPEKSKLGKISVQKLSDDICKTQYAPLSITEHMTCYYQFDKECRGDYGSPLIVNDKQLGIYSWGSNGICGSYQLPTVYTDISNKEIADYITYCLNKKPCL